MRLFTDRCHLSLTLATYAALRHLRPIGLINRLDIDVVSLLNIGARECDAMRENLLERPSPQPTHKQRAHRHERPTVQY